MRTLFLMMVLLSAVAAQGQNPGTATQVALQTGNITATGQAVTVATTGYTMATVSVHGTYSGVGVRFQFSDDGGTTYYPTTCARVDVAVQETGELVADNAARAWDCSVYGTTQLQVFPTAYTSGTAIVGITLINAPIEAAPTNTLTSPNPGINNPVAITGVATIGALPVQNFNGKLQLPCNALRTTNCQ